MSDTLRQHGGGAVQPTPSESSEAVLAGYEQLAEAWARQGLLVRAIALCKVILRLDPAHEPARRLLAELDARRVEPHAPTGPAVPRPQYQEPASGKGSSGNEVAPRASLLSRLGKREFMSMMETLQPRIFQPGESIVEEGQPGSSMFAIVEGSVEVVRTLKSGRRRTVAFMGEGDFFGEMSLLASTPRFATVRAFERTAVLELTREQLEQLLERHPSVEEVLQGFHRERLLEDVLRGNLLFRSLSTEQREDLARDFQICTRPAGTVLLEQGKEVDALYLLLRGRCEVSHRHQDGSQVPLRTLGEGDMFGEIALMLGLPATATVCADTDCILLRLDWKSCEQHLLSDPGVCEALSRLGNERLLNSAGLFWEPSPPPGGTPRA
ncbi:cyclic nucleotide-binding domain-containing protein [Archangium lansingense]|uniref:cyclic nucleotide-binding domain-containing protein n=1 Tax=Archangium lansingense TaxID=2995310 RepID=UPI003B7F2411